MEKGLRLESFSICSICTRTRSDAISMNTAVPFPVLLRVQPRLGADLCHELVGKLPVVPDRVQCGKVRRREHAAGDIHLLCLFLDTYQPATEERQDVFHVYIQPDEREEEPPTSMPATGFCDDLRIELLVQLFSIPGKRPGLLYYRVLAGESRVEPPSFEGFDNAVRAVLGKEPVSTILSRLPAGDKDFRSYRSFHPATSRGG